MAGEARDLRVAAPAGTWDCRVAAAYDLRHRCVMIEAQSRVMITRIQVVAKVPTTSILLTFLWNGLKFLRCCQTKGPAARCPTDIFAALSGPTCRGTECNFFKTGLSIG